MNAGERPSAPISRSGVWWALLGGVCFSVLTSEVAPLIVDSDRVQVLIALCAGLVGMLLTAYMIDVARGRRS